MKSKLRVIEICAGAGGQSLGLERAGFHHELAIELDETAAATLKLNRRNWNVAVGDVADKSVWNPADYSPHNLPYRIDLFAGGVPCPPFSIAGKQLGSSDERDLFAWAVEQVGVIRPRAVMLENVRGLSMPRFRGYRQHVLDRFEELGYRAEWRLINSSDYGVAQLRPRFVLIAMEQEEFQFFHWPEPKNRLVTVGQALKSLMAENGWEGAPEWAEAANGIGPTIVGGSKKHGGADLGPTRAKQSWAELGVNGKGIADSAPMPGDKFEIGPKLTLDMVAKLQGWGSREFSWKFAGKKTSIYRQIGNAFPPPVARALGLAIARALNGTGEVREDQDDSRIVDPIYKFLKDNNSFMTAKQIIDHLSVDLTIRDLQKHLVILEKDFEVERVKTGSQWAYKIGKFKAFIGQEDHSRHAYFEDFAHKVS
ncbi:DNA (cytosine-5-)-methyltransferase [Glutamicibacter halophytocola]|uniref:Cytosine-specific methyltransferase n=1 Tax=Glutamicibacter halophytocola TaxID=1933880 RepID=A0ABX5YAB0_9MICC|nr:DNA (cytosine-5-)-methyltransferase [Glutamicibacter halophytocola]QDY66596.1 DNA (cytosine-5-)-methyltransferase [Glutamicibacter halophytocola]